MNTSSDNHPVLAPTNNPLLRARLWALVGTLVLVVPFLTTGCVIDTPTNTYVSAQTKPDSKPTPSGSSSKPTRTADPEPAEPMDKEEPEDKSVYKLPPVPKDVNRKQVAPDLFFEKEGEKEAEKRRMIVHATICLREGQWGLEGLLTKGKGKEHEYILTTDCDAMKMHAVLLMAGAEPGSPVRYAPQYSPACGDPIKITIRYMKDGKLVSVPAQQWVRDAKTKKEMTQDWVFAGSQLRQDIEDPKKKNYLANWGDVVCITNMESAMLDLPSPRPGAGGIENRTYEAWTERIPPIGTKVEMVFEVGPKKK